MTMLIIWRRTMGGKWLMKTFLKSMMDWLLLSVFGKVAGLVHLF